MNSIQLAQDIIKRLERVEGNTAVSALEIAIIAIRNQSAIAVLAGGDGLLRTASGEPLEL